MSVNLEKKEDFTIFNTIESHLAWHGNIPGLNAEKLLRGNKTPFTFLIRQGELSSVENQQNYYVTFVAGDLSIKHQPIVIKNTVDGWCYENGKPAGPFINFTIDDVIHMIMESNEDQPTPFNQ